MPGTPTTRLGLYRPASDGSDNPSHYRTGLDDHATKLDKAVTYAEGAYGSRPAAGIAGRHYRATSGDPSGAPVLYVDIGASWVALGSGVDQAAGVPSLRTLGTGATQAAAGNDARLSDARTPTTHAAAHRVGGSDELAHSVLTAQQVGSVGVSGQIRAGRALTPADFTSMGLSTPVGLWSLSNVNDSSGNARHLTNKGSMPFGPGLTGAATEALVGAGSTAQALYLADTGAADPFRIKTGSWFCWFRTAKRGTSQGLVTKYVGSQRVFMLFAESSTNTAGAVISVTGAVDFPVYGSTDVCDDRWHFAVATYDGTVLRLYVDGALEGSVAAVGTMFSGSAPLNIGGYGADGSTAATWPHYGRIDEAGVLADVLSEDQVRMLYAAKVAHGYPVAPTRAHLSVRRARRGAALVTGDFPSTPVRLHNFTAGALTDAGSGGVTLTANNSPPIVAGADGSAAGAYGFLTATSHSLSATDTGLPSGTASRTYGLWFKSVTAASYNIMGWGTSGTADARLLTQSNGAVSAASGSDSVNGPIITDGQWHHLVVVEDNAAADGVKRKLYVDGRLVVGSTVLTSLTLAGANSFRVGAGPAGAAPMTGQADVAFVGAFALTPEQVVSLYAKGAQALPPSQKEAGAHVEAFDATSVYVIFDTLKPQDQVDLAVAA